MKKRIAIFISIIMALVVSVTLVGCSSGCSFTPSVEGGNSNNSATSQVVAPTNLPNSVTESSNIIFATDTAVRADSPLSLQTAAEKVKGSCVMITVETADGAGAGSGVIVDVNDGKSSEDTIFYVLTCAHVCVEGSKINMYLPDKNFRYNENPDYLFKGVIGGKKETVQDNAVTLVGADKDSDVAVLKLNIAGSKLTAADVCEVNVIPDEYGVSYGEQVFAIGNPSGMLPGTLSAGQISYLNRVTSVEEIGEMTLLQIDVSTNPGSSGGALFNMYGELIGLTSSGNTEFTNLNFAIPHKIAVAEGEIDNGFVNIAKQLIGTAVANDFNNYGYVSGRKQKLGITIVLDDTGTKVGIAEVVAGSVAESKGLAVNDIITGISLYAGGGETLTEHKNVSAVTDFSSVMSKANIGDKIVISYTRLVRQGYQTIERPLSVEFTMLQYYFCNTGVYPQG